LTEGRLFFCHQTKNYDSKINVQNLL